MAKSPEHPSRNEITDQVIGYFAVRQIDPDYWRQLTTELWESLPADEQAALATSDHQKHPEDTRAALLVRYVGQQITLTEQLERQLDTVVPHPLDNPPATPIDS
jgi:hypothetical protein